MRVIYLTKHLCEAFHLEYKKNAYSSKSGFLQRTQPKWLFDFSNAKKKYCSMKLAGLLIVGYILAVVSADLGVDMSQDTCSSATQDDWDCLAKNGITYAVIEAWNGGHQASNYLGGILKAHHIIC